MKVRVFTGPAYDSAGTNTTDRVARESIALVNAGRAKQNHRPPLPAFSSSTYQAKAQRSSSDRLVNFTIAVPGTPLPSVAKICVTLEPCLNLSVAKFLGLGLSVGATEPSPAPRSPWQEMQ